MLMGNKSENINLDKTIIVFKKFYYINVFSGQENKNKPVDLIKQNDPKQNYSSQVRWINGSK